MPIYGGMSVLATFLLGISAFGQAAPQQALGDMYKDIIAQRAEQRHPKLEDVSNNLERIPDMSSSEVRAAIPMMLRAAGDPDLDARKYGFLGLVTVDRRPDSSVLLADSIPQIAKGLADQDQNVRAGAILALSSMRPRPPDSVIPYLIGSLYSDSENGPGVVFGLVQIDPNRDEVAAELAKYAASPALTLGQRVDVLNAMANRSVRHKEILAQISSMVLGQPEEVQLAALRAISTIGPAALDAARTNVEKLAKQDDASPKARAAAAALAGSSH